MADLSPLPVRLETGAKPTFGTSRYENRHLCGVEWTLFGLWKWPECDPKTYRESGLKRSQSEPKISIKVLTVMCSVNMAFTYRKIKQTKSWSRKYVGSSEKSCYRRAYTVLRNNARWPIRSARCALTSPMANLYPNWHFKNYLSKKEEQDAIFTS